jgi:hypothetical protein
MYKISEIPKFYSLDNLEIDGYKLYLVNITEGSLLFKFVPIEEFDYEYVISLGTNNILIDVRRWEWWSENPVRSGEICAADPLNSFARNSQWGHLTDDNMLYKGDEITAQMGDTVFTIKVPYRLSDYEFLRDLALRVIATSELVDVEYELDVIRQNVD